jgi:isopropylmalate/homocitrate/citramalate synthase
MKPWKMEGKWYVSYMGWEENIRKDMPLLPKKVGIRDVTYREGDDCPGFTLSVDEKMELLRYAVDMGIEEIDIGGPSMHPHQFQFAEAVKASGLNVRRTGRFFANTTMDYKKAADICMEAGSTNIRIVIMALNEEEIFKQLKVFPAMVEYCHTQHNAEVCWSLSDTLRVRMELIRKVYEEGTAAGADKASVNDTFGVATPAIMRYLSATIRKIIPNNMPMKTHCHNNYGMATANTLASVEGGANEVDVAINGYGDDAGNASLEEVAVGLEALYGIDTGLKLDMLTKYSQRAIEIGRLPIQAHKAIVGENAFLRPMYVWSGKNMAAESWQPSEPLNPKVVGAEDKVVFGPKGSLDNEPIEWKLKELGIPYTAADIERVRETVGQMIKEELTVKVPRKYVTELEFEDICRKVARGPKA